MKDSNWSRSDGAKKALPTDDDDCCIAGADVVEGSLVIEESEGNSCSFNFAVGLLVTGVVETLPSAAELKVVILTGAETNDFFFEPRPPANCDNKIAGFFEGSDVLEGDGAAILAGLRI